MVVTNCLVAIPKKTLSYVFFGLKPVSIVSWGGFFQVTRQTVTLHTHEPGPTRSVVRISNKVSGMGAAVWRTEALTFTGAGEAFVFHFVETMSGRADFLPAIRATCFCGIFSNVFAKGDEELTCNAAGITTAAGNCG